MTKRGTAGDQISLGAISSWHHLTLVYHVCPTDGPAPLSLCPLAGPALRWTPRRCQIATKKNLLSPNDSRLLLAPEAKLALIVSSDCFCK